MSIKLDTYNTADNKVTKSQFNFEVIEDINIGLLHQVVKSNRTNYRNNTASVKTRSQVSGTGAKPWAQKGTGRARQGSLRSPQFVGGGIAHGPGGRVYLDRTPKKMKKKSLNMAISQRIKEEALFVIDGQSVDVPSTKLASTVLSEFNIERSFIFVYGEGDDNLIKSFRNLKNSRIVSVKKLSTYDVVSTDNAVLSKNAMDYLTGEVK
ncbi:MAG: 50S ribosomal protein L4 [Candidatus Actinomarina sp.]|jgi:large subunit ribosomal protein L4|nr:50S ribosomal protein L4 [Actinomycetota bacterium]MDA9590227.1 50S ribosomal protein L4 [Candidatus Actinomarina sp.]MDA9630090.1 50S ribosomal protein L4 [bacterium]MBT7014548.1 50S ribosomal protein L4 [Actinomycetota bacterium]MDA9688037.1 50S ribosomal protein L4 [Candidatus Actinomarina sp.]|tara:strand:+ start:10031 stop:10654 length:624 start_codon:yes stop_codon:yes gene_type:complete